MNEPPAIRFPPECSRCRFYFGNPYLFCAVMPDGLEGDFCPHFAPDPDAPQLDELWEPLGARYIGDELVVERVTYNGEEIAQPTRQLTREEQLQLLDTHPLFTGKCPECGYTFDRDYTCRIHYDCPECGWMDDS
jgi:predicted RNA-binding Zn-ribbon protein involved in translation (DUF1610 family)